jgi:predicted dehydrogenase
MHIAVVGTGSIGLRHLRLLREVEGVVPVAVPARPSRAAELRSQGITTASSAEAALELGLSGAIVATDTGRHVADTETFLRACPVLVEKPMAPTAGDAERMIAAARSRGRALHVACCLRFDAALHWAHQRRSALGSPTLLDAECLSWLPAWRPGRELLSTYSARTGEGGVLLDLIHEIDSSFWFAGPFRTVVAELDNQALVGLPKDVDETAAITARHASGVRSTIRLSYAVRPEIRRLRFWGTAGVVEWNGIERRSELRDVSGNVQEAFTGTGPDDMYRAQRDAWLASLRGEPSPRLVPAADGLHALKVCDAARLAAKSGIREEIS